MSRRRQRSEAQMPGYLLRYDWRDWRPPADRDDPYPWYSTWYLGLGDWRLAREAWASGREVPVRQLPREVPPPRGDLTAPAPEQPRRDKTESAALNRGPHYPRARVIKS